MTKTLKFRAWSIKTKEMYQVYSLTFLPNGIGCDTLGVNIKGENPDLLN